MCIGRGWVSPGEDTHVYNDAEVIFLCGQRKSSDQIPYRREQMHTRVHRDGSPCRDGDFTGIVHAGLGRCTCL